MYNNLEDDDNDDDGDNSDNNENNIISNDDNDDITNDDDNDGDDDDDVAEDLGASTVHLRGSSRHGLSAPLMAAGAMDSWWLHGRSW